MKQIKKKVLIILMLLSSVAVFSQTESIEKTPKYGIYLGLNHSDLEIRNAPNDFIISTDLGFQLGILANFEILNWLSFSPKMELSVNSAKIDRINQTYQVMPANIGIIGHLNLKIPNKKLEPYLFFGPHFRHSLMRKTLTSAEFPTDSGLSFDIGIGTARQFKHFAFAPEVRYSHGLSNVNGNPSLQGVKYHNLSLIFNFWD